MTKHEEMLAWAKSLKPGDKVIHVSHGYPEDNLSIFEVARVTPSGRVVTTNHKTFAQAKWCDDIVAWGSGHGKIVRVTDELLQKAQKQDAERAEKERKEKTIVKAREIIIKEWEKQNRLTYDRAVKIIAAFDNM